MRKFKNEVKEDDYYLCESDFGIISRSFVLPDNIDRDKIQAKFEDGRLYLTLEKLESKKTKIQWRNIMNKTLSSLLFSSLLAGSVMAAPIAGTNLYDTDFARMNQYFNSLIESHLSSSVLNNFSYPRTDIKDEKDKIVLQFDLAGVDKKNITLSIDENKILTLAGEKRESKEEKSKNYVKKEIFYGKFKKVIQLPENIDENRLQTKFENGILTLTIPKTEVKKPKVKLIPIK